MRGQAQCLNAFQTVDIAVFERAVGEAQLLGSVIDEENTFHEQTVVETTEVNATTEVQRL